MNSKTFPIAHNNTVKFWVDSDLYNQQYLKLIKNAKHSIHLQTYILLLDSFGAEVCQELIHACLRGIKVYLLIDAVGSRDFPEAEENRLKAYGIHFLRFNSFQMNWLYRWGRRLHHKILLIDETTSMIGGINIQVAEDLAGENARLDFAVFLQGPIILNLTKYCQEILNQSSKVKYHFDHEKISPNEIINGIDVGISVNDWVLGHQEITKYYAKITTEATDNITIINSYFFPRKKFMKQLIEASKRGVRIRLILSGLSDWPSYIYASEHLYSYLLNHKIEIYQWKKSILHGKLATIDNKFTTVGSFNLNYTSYQQNLEMNVNLYSKEFTKNINEKIELLIIDGCEKVDPDKFTKKRKLKDRFWSLFYYLILSIVANFSIGLTFKEKLLPEKRIVSILRIFGAIFFLIIGIIGIILPVMPGIPFLMISFFLVYRQIIFNK